MKAIIWGSCGSLPSPISSATIRRKLSSALWAARDTSFENKEAVEAFIDNLPHSTRGTYKANTSCVQITNQSDEIILCDAGTGIRDYALSIPPEEGPKTYHIFISHLHWDHIQGFPFFNPAYVTGNTIIIHGFHPEIEETLRLQMKAPCFPVPFEAMRADIKFDIREDGSEFQVGRTRIRTIKQQHPGDSWGYRFEEDGKSIVYSTDSEHGPEAREPNYPFIKFFEYADVLIFDGQYTFEQASNEKRYWGHSDHLTAIELGARAKTNKLVIFHHEPAHSDREIEKIHEQAIVECKAFNRTLDYGDATYPKQLFIAYDGLTVEA
ncbi:MAG: MBL fold metallo-hydrolase [Verrucomicrobiota bacterium]